MHTAHKALLGGLEAPTRTTRMTPRLRAPKGMWPGIRYAVLASKPPGLIEELMDRRDMPL